jgi:hypothetical protein
VAVPAFAFLAELLVLALAVAIGYLLGRNAAVRGSVDPATVEAVRHEIAGLRGLVGRIKDTAWDHRELDSALSTIIMDEIRTYEKKELGE